MAWAAKQTMKQVEEHVKLGQHCHLVVKTLLSNVNVTKNLCDYTVVNYDAR